ncbi:MAG: site-specific integrase [FCB group bacterium]|nr:site-specific integrase [FCB group bacterium]
MRVVGKFNCFARTVGIDSVASIDEPLVDRFINAGLLPKSEFRLGPLAMCHLMNHLRQKGIIKTHNTPLPEEPYADLLSSYEANLRDVRGLAPATRKGYLRESRRLLTWFQQRYEGNDISRLSGSDILTFITESIEQIKDPYSNQQLCCLTRVFLRYLYREGIIESPLDRVVPKYPVWRLSSIPRHIPWERVRRLIDSVDTSVARGKRDKAILLLIATFGLRNSDVHSVASTIKYRIEF